MAYNCNSCTRQCNKLCPRYIISDSVSIVTVDGTDTLVIDIPAGTYMNGYDYCIVMAQARPAAATVNMPVAISIGGVTTTVYPLICCRSGLQVVACQVDGRTRYKVRVRTNATTGSFVVYSGLGSCLVSRLTSLPVATATPAVALLTTSIDETANKVTKTTTIKEVVSRE